MKQAKDYDQRLDNLRAFAIIVVVLGHSIILYSGSWGIYHSEQSCSFFYYLKEVINLFQMPLFFSMSGFLFAKTAKTDSFIEFMVKKIKRLIVPHLFIGLAYMIPLKMLLKYPGYHNVSFPGAVKRFINGADMGHLWFLPTLFLCFTLSFWIKKWFGNRILTWLIITLLAALLSLARWKDGPYVIYIRYFLEYYWSFSAGALLYKLDLQKISIRWKSVIALAAVSGIVVSIVFKMPFLSLAVSALITLTCYLFAPETSGPITECISKNSFGIYLLHSPLIYITFTYMLNAVPVAVFAVNFFVFGLLALILSHLFSGTIVKYVLGLWS